MSSTGSDDLAESLLAHGDLESGVGEVALWERKCAGRGRGASGRETARCRASVRRWFAFWPLRWSVHTRPHPGGLNERRGRKRN